MLSTCIEKNKKKKRKKKNNKKKTKQKKTNLVASGFEAGSNRERPHGSPM